MEKRLSLIFYSNENILVILMDQPIIVKTFNAERSFSMPYEMLLKCGDEIRQKVQLEPRPQQIKVNMFADEFEKLFKTEDEEITIEEEVIDYSIHLLRVLYKKNMWTRGCKKDVLNEARQTFLQDAVKLSQTRGLYRYNFNMPKFLEHVKHSKSVKVIQKELNVLPKTVQDEVIRYACDWLKSFRDKEKN